MCFAILWVRSCKSKFPLGEKLGRTRPRTMHHLVPHRWIAGPKFSSRNLFKAVGGRQGGARAHMLSLFAARHLCSQTRLITYMFSEPNFMVLSCSRPSESRPLSHVNCSTSRRQEPNRICKSTLSITLIAWQHRLANSSSAALSSCPFVSLPPSC